VLFADDAKPAENVFGPDSWCGFYWTEGLRGLGWAIDAVPTLKGGSTIGIPSPPGIWDSRRGTIKTPEIRDAERLQGFDPDWTLPALSANPARPGHRWKLVGNAVSVPVAEWVAGRLAAPGAFDRKLNSGLLPRGVAWPKAAWGHKGKVYAVECSMWPVRRPSPRISEFLAYPLKDLSLRAAQGFLSRALVGHLRFQDGFLDDVRSHIDRLVRTPAA
jgi:DNA (cytosine-5)-methyltransferase 1